MLYEGNGVEIDIFPLCFSFSCNEEKHINGSYKKKGELTAGFPYRTCFAADDIQSILAKIWNIYLNEKFHLLNLN